MLFVGRSTYLNKNHITQMIRWKPTDTTDAHYEITMASNNSQPPVYKIYRNEPEYDHISHFLKEESIPMFNYSQFAEVGRALPQGSPRD